EVQLLGDATGQVIALGERDCSTQRRHQKLIEEAPAPGLAETERRRLHAMAVRLGVAVGLQNAATVEFLCDRDGAFWFLEVNTRLQVEHPVTELVSGLDLVVEQFRLAAGAPLSPRVLAVADRAARPTSHAIEVRISAEDPARVFAPAPGRITRWVMPAGPGIRVDTAVEAGDRIPPEYDPLICKLIVHAADRPTALARLRRALDETEIGGIQTTLPFHLAMLAEPGFIDTSALATTWVEAHWDGPASRARAVRVASLAAGLAELGGGASDGSGGLDGSGAPVAPAAGTPIGAGTVRQGSDGAVAVDKDPGWRSVGRAGAVDRWPR
ncbi:MAG TPA: carbamoyl phosphate synthase, partial [Candidatus Limnocylindrales bacterium]